MNDYFGWNQNLNTPFVPNAQRVGSGPWLFDSADYRGTLRVTGQTVNLCAGPVIGAVSANPAVLWPPDHKLVAINVTVSTSGGCGAISSKIVAVSSNEATGPGDWLVTDDLSLYLRAERDGAGRGRIYSITVQVTDGAANSTTGIVTVSVPHDLSVR